MCWGLFGQVGQGGLTGFGKGSWGYDDVCKKRC